MIAHTGNIWSVDFSPNDEYIISTSYGMKLWDAKFLEFEKCSSKLIKNEACL